MAHICSSLIQYKTTYQDKISIISNDIRYTGLQFYNRISSLSLALQSELNNIPTGSDIVISFFGLTTNLYFETLLTCISNGWIIALLNYRWSATEAIEAYESIKATILVFDDYEISISNEILKKNPNHIGIYLGTKFQYQKHNFKLNNRMIYIEDLINKRYQYNKYLNLKIADQRDNIAILCFTSGTTTGKAKAVAISHYALIHQSLIKLYICNYNKNDVYLHMIPLCHIGGLVSAFSMLLSGAVHILMPKFNANLAVNLIEKYNVTAIITIPTIINDMYKLNKKFNSMKKILNGASAMSNQQIDMLFDMFPNINLYTAYGMTEACSSLTYHGPFNILNKYKLYSSNHLNNQNFTCVGLPGPGIQIQIKYLNEEYGEILTRGPHVMMTCSNEWFNTGDIGKIDNNGYLHLSGRSKDIIRSGGETIRAIELENVLIKHPVIKEVVILGLNDIRLGEMVCAFITLNIENYKFEKSDNLICTLNGNISIKNNSMTNDNYNLSIDELNEFLIENGISKYKKPKLYIIELSGELVKTSTGKINRGQLKKLADELYIKKEYYNTSKL